MCTRRLLARSPGLALLSVTNRRHEDKHGKTMLDSGGNIVVRMKEEGFVVVWSRRRYAEGIFSSVSEMLPKPVKKGHNRNEFAQKYGLVHSGMNPKQVKCPKDCEEKDVLALFVPYVGKNGHNYMHYGDEELIMYIEQLWMITTMSSP